MNKELKATAAADRTLNSAKTGDALTGAELHKAIYWLNAQADALNNEKTANTSIEDLKAISQQQSDLRAQATGLIALNIQWLAGQAKVEVEHINDALDYAKGVIDKVTILKQRLDSIAAVVTFLGVLLTATKIGDIIAAGNKLKGDLDSASKKG